MTVDTYKLTKLDKSPIWSLIYPFKPWLPRSLKDKNSKNQEGYTCAGLVITRFNQQKVKGYLLRKKRSVLSFFDTQTEIKDYIICQVRSEISRIWKKNAVLEKVEQWKFHTLIVQLQWFLGARVLMDLKCALTPRHFFMASLRWIDTPTQMPQPRHGISKITFKELSS